MKDKGGGESSDQEKEVKPKKLSAEITKLSQRKKALEEKLVSLERQIYALEGSYLQDTCHVGNILTGWDNYLTSRGSGALKRPMKYKESDRLFSLSSVTSLKSSDTKLEVRTDAGNGSDEDRRPSKQQKTSKKHGTAKPRKKNMESDDEDY